MSNGIEQNNWARLMMTEYNKDPKRFQREFLVKPDAEVVKNLDARMPVGEDWVSEIITSYRRQFRYDHQDAKIEHINLDLYFDEDNGQWNARINIEYTNTP